MAVERKELRQLVALIVAVALAMLVIGPASANGAWRPATFAPDAAGHVQALPHR